MRQTLVYPIPCGDCVSKLVLPRDLSQAEADRFCTLIQTLVIPDGHRNTERNDGGSASVLAILQGRDSLSRPADWPAALLPPDAVPTALPAAGVGAAARVEDV
jgi:hypothetical protein